MLGVDRSKETNSPVMGFYFNMVKLLVPNVHWKVIKYVWPFIGNEVLKETTFARINLQYITNLWWCHLYC